MIVTNMSEMWAFLDCYTLDPASVERKVNHLNEWGGFSRRLEIPIFTGWSDFACYDKTTKMTTMLVLDSEWSSKVGVNNQEFWLNYAEQNSDGVAAFFVIHAVDKNAEVRKIASIEDSRIFVGKVVRERTQTFIVGQPKVL